MPNRTLVLRFALVMSIAFSLSFTIRAELALACTPPLGGHPTSTVADRVNQADFVFEGTVTAQSADHSYNVTVNVGRYFKGEGQKTVSLGRYGTSALCLEEASLGMRYIFYANGDSSENMGASYIGTRGLDQPDSDIIAEIVATVGQPPVLPIGEMYWLYLPLIAR